MKLKFISLMFIVILSGCSANRPQDEINDSTVISADTGHTYDKVNGTYDDTQIRKYADTLSLAENNCLFNDRLYSLGSVVNMDNGQRICSMNDPRARRNGVNYGSGSDQQVPMWVKYH